MKIVSKLCARCCVSEKNKNGAYCTPCQALNHKEYAENNREKISASQRKYYRRNAARERAVKRVPKYSSCSKCGIVFDSLKMNSRCGSCIWEYSKQSYGPFSSCRKCKTEKPPSLGAYCWPCEKSMSQERISRIPCIACRKRNKEYEKGLCRTCYFKDKPDDRFLVDLENEKYFYENRPHELLSISLKARVLNSKKISANNRISRKKSASGSLSSSEWSAIIKKQKGVCAFYGTPFAANKCESRNGNKANLTVDHILPISAGGSNWAYNIQGLCLSCNAKKRDRILPIANPSLFDSSS